MLLLFCFITEQFYAFTFIPAPKQIQYSAFSVSLPSIWNVTGEKTPASDWLKEELPGNYGITLRASGEFIVEYLRQNHLGPEEYRLEIIPDKIKLTASTEEGFFRATGRLLSILKQATCENNKNILPGLSLQDRPDFPRRGMTLQMPFPGSLSYSGRLYSIERALDYMAINGFNFVIMEVGASFNSTHFKSPKRLPWAEKDLIYLVNYAKKRGLEPIPAMNTFGHVARAAEICPLRNASGKLIGMDVREKEFFKEYRVILDELLRIFENPRYFHIGCDENEEVFRKLAETPAKGALLYSNTINKISKYLKTRQCRTVIWHDMMYSSWDSMTRDAITKLSRDVIIDVWLYDTREEYPEVDYFLKHGFETWATPWNEASNIRNFIRYAARKKVKTILGSTWNCPHKETTAFILTAEYSWNPSTEIHYNPVLEFMKSYQKTNVLKSYQSHLTPLSWQGEKSLTNKKAPHHYATPYGLLSANQGWIFGKNSIKEIQSPDEYRLLKGTNSSALLSLYCAEHPQEMLLIDTLNTKRTTNSVIAYTPAFGASTKNNQWGLDCEIISHKVTKVLNRHKDVTIPKNGFIITSHGGTKRKEWMHHNLKTGTSTGLKVFTPIKTNTQPEAILPSNTQNIILILGIERLFLVKTRATYGFVVITDQQNKEERFPIMNDYAFEPYLENNSPFRCSYLSSSIQTAQSKLILSWKNSSQKSVQKIHLEYTNLGIAAGLKICASGVSQ